MSSHEPHTPHLPGDLNPPAFLSQPAWRSEDLLRGAAEALILHADAVYRLRLTAQGKLILTK